MNPPLLVTNYRKALPVPDLSPAMLPWPGHGSWRKMIPLEQYKSGPCRGSADPAGHIIIINISNAGKHRKLLPRVLSCPLPVEEEDK